MGDLEGVVCVVFLIDFLRQQKQEVDLVAVLVLVVDRC
jgi:hypothetical protein